MKYNIIVGGNTYKQLTYSEIILYIRKLILNEISTDFSIELKNSNVIEGIDRFINAGSIKIQTLHFSCIKGLCSFTGLNNISCHWFQNHNIKDLHVYSPCSLILINDIFDDKIYTTANIFFILAAESELVETICTHCINNAVPAVYDFSVFKNIIESTKKMRYRNKAQRPFKLDMYKRRFKNNMNAQRELLISSSF